MNVSERIAFKARCGIQYRTITIELEDCYFHFYFEYDQTNPYPTVSSESRLLKESRTLTIGNGFGLRFDRDTYCYSHNPCKDHIHVFSKGREIFAINRDGSVHDGSQGMHIPNSVYDYIASHYPDFALSPSHVIESLEIVNPRINEELLFLIG